MHNEISKMLPASAGQRLLWAFERRHGESGAMNIAIVVRLCQQLDKDAMQRALHAIVARHQSLRTSLVWQSRKLVQIISPSWRPELKCIDFQHAVDPDKALKDALQCELTTNISLTDGPIRASIFTLENNSHILCLNIHHFVTDSVSNGIVLYELGQLYLLECGEDHSTLPDVNWQYSDWSAWQNEQIEGSERDRYIKFWNGVLQDAEPPHFPVLASVSDGARLTAHEYIQMDTKLFQLMGEIAKKQRASLFSVILAIFYIAISRITKQKDITVSTMLNDRLRPEIFSTVGYFVSVVPLRVKFSESDTFLDFVRLCRNSIFNAMQNQVMPMHMLSSGLNQSGKSRVDDVVIQLLGNPANTPNPFAPWEDMKPDIGGGRTFGLEVVVQPIADIWHVSVLYNSSQYEKSFIATLLSHFNEAASCALNKPTDSLASFLWIEEQSEVNEVT